MVVHSSLDLCIIYSYVYCVSCEFKLNFSGFSLEGGKFKLNKLESLFVQNLNFQDLQVNDTNIKILIKIRET